MVELVEVVVSAVLVVLALAQALRGQVCNMLAVAVVQVTRLALVAVAVVVRV